LSQEWQLWSVGVEPGATARYLDFSMANLNDVRPAPDGTRLVFASSSAERRLRVVENVFSALP
jgi:Tol biopolymer transport system component